MSARTTRRLVATLELGAPQNPIDVTVVLPAYNEAEGIRESYEQIAGVMDRTGLDYGLIFVDDGSTDATWRVIREISEHDPRVRGLRHRGNSGKASALANGFTYACGNIVATCDADMQYDAKDILRVIDKVLEGYDAVSANKVNRSDPLSKRLPSKFFNFFVRNMTGVKLHDINAGLKAYRHDASQELIRYGYGELHRFFIVILALKGFSVTEIPVEGRPRLSGRSKYGPERYLRGAMDFFTVFFMSGYMERPLHLFGGFGVLFWGLGTLLVAYMATAYVVAEQPFGSGPLLQLAALLILSGTQLFAVGLVAEMIGNLGQGARPKGKVSEVMGVDRRTNIGVQPGVVVERRRSQDQPVLLEPDAEPVEDMPFALSTDGRDADAEPAREIPHGPDRD